MATMTFQINDASTESNIPAVWVTITENADGTLTFNVTQQGGIIGDLRGVFFDVADESILKSLVVAAASTDIRIGDDSIKDLGDGANMNGLTGSDKGYDLGIEIGTSGIGKDDIRSYSFTLDSTARDLTLSDFSNVDFAVRLTSVGVIGGARADSSKLLEITSQAVDARNDLASVNENVISSGNVLANDANGGGTSTVTSWSAGALGSTVGLSSEGDIIGSLQLNADGSYVVDASAADELSAGEHIVYNFTYGVRNQTEATSWSDDTANLTVIINGTNDGPVAGDDATSTGENAAPATGSVMANDSDVDRLDTISVTGWSGGQLGSAATIENGAGASVTLNADGSYVVDASAADALSAGETIAQQFQYTLSDNHGATDAATFTVTVTGANDGPVANDDAAGSVAENSILTGSVTANDSDVDRLDTHTWAVVDGSFGGQGSLTMNADGTWSYDAQGAYDYLNDGQSVNLSFQYQMTDNHGATDTAVVSFAVTGVGSSDNGGGGGDNGGSGTIATDENSYPTFQKDISHAVLVFDTTSGDRNGDGYYTVKIDEWAGNTDLEKTDLDASIDDILSWLVANDANIDANTVFLGAQIKGGDVGSAPASYDDYWANDGDSVYTIATITKDSGNGTTTEWVSGDEAPVDMGQIYQNQVDTTYDYNFVV